MHELGLCSSIVAGLDPSDFAGTVAGHLAAVHVDDRDDVRDAMEAAVAKGEVFEIRCRIVRPDGSERGSRNRRGGASSKRVRLPARRGAALGRSVRSPAPVTRCGTCAGRQACAS